MKLFAFPYAFGNSTVYDELKLILSPKVDLMAFSFSGHGERYCEELMYTIDDIAEDMYKKIKPYLYQPYALLGYSMGCKIVLEVYRRILKNQDRMPEHLFCLASDSPNIVHDQCEYEKYGLEDVRKVLINKKGTAQSLIDNDELIELMMPIVKADLIALRDYRFDIDGFPKSKCNVTIVRGSQENDLVNCRENWEISLNNEVEYVVLDGEHFFMFDKESDNCKIVGNIILETLF